MSPTDTPPQPPVAEEAVRLKLVPVSATDAMMDAAHKAARAQLPAIDGRVGFVQLRAAWDAFLSAAPPSPAGEDVERVARVIDEPAWDRFPSSFTRAPQEFMWAQARRDDALSKAREIIALLSGRKQDE